MSSSCNRGKNIILAGFMGTGKSSIGKLLAKKLGRKFFDLDEAIEGKAKKTISEIFSQEGEQYFRNLEKDGITHVLRLESFVVAVGGGAVVNPENMSLLKKSGLVICLEASADEILKRTSGQSHDRPLLKSKTKDEVQALINVRMPFYKKADILIDTDRKNPDEVVDAIIGKLENHGNCNC